MLLASMLHFGRRRCLLYLSVLVLLSSCSTIPASLSANPASPTSTSSGVQRTPPPVLPASTQGDCPANGTTRPAAMSPLTLGHHQNLVYIVNEFHGQQNGIGLPTFGTLKRYDVATGQKTEIVKIPGATLLEAQVSANGQWLLFVAQRGNQAKLQLVRMDGKALQTLYCAPPSSNQAESPITLSNIQWSFDQKHVVFITQVNLIQTLYLLNMQNGNLHTELSEPAFLRVVGWLDNTRLLLQNPGVDSPPTNLWLLDTNHASPQTTDQLQPLYHTAPTVFCWDAASSPDGAHLFLSQCTTDIGQSSPSAYPAHGPSNISQETATGGSPHTIFTSSRLGITAVRVINQTDLLLQVKSFGPHVDTSQNGLWKVNTDGTGLTLLSHDSAELNTRLNDTSQYPWSNTSRDGSFYSVQSEGTTSSGDSQFTLLVGSLHGGAPQAFASISDGTNLSLAGWTSM